MRGRGSAAAHGREQSEPTPSHIPVDDSLNYYALVRSGDATAEGGSGVASVVEQNTAQLGRQNNSCNNNSFNFSLTDSRLSSRCIDKDSSRNKHTRVKGGGAKAKTDVSTAPVRTQTTAQEGRQNNSCDNNTSFDILLTGTEATSLCANKDTSRNKHTRVKAGGAKAEAGTSAASADHQNTAQEGRQNNNCNSLAITSVDATDARLSSECTNKDGSKNHKTTVKAGGAKAKSGNDIGTPEVQNTAQEGRQNNNCSNQNFVGLNVVRGETDTRCANKDRSKNHKTTVKSGPAEATGSDGNSISEQNTAQDGRQNNNCSNRNFPDPSLTDSRENIRCANKDRSKNHKTTVKSGPAKATGSDGLAAVLEQNTAQVGRQNNDCANTNAGAGFPVLTDSEKRTTCKTLDASKNVRTKEKRGTVEAEGGDSTMVLFQRNTAQTGRQSNSCDNSNNTQITASGTRSTTQCVAVDRSKNIGSSYR